MKTRRECGLELLNRFCDALGLPDTVRAVHIHLDCHGTAIVNVEQILRDGSGVDVITQGYELVAMEPDPTSGGVPK